MPAKSDVSPAAAFKVYVEMGDSRTILGLASKLKKMCKGKPAPSRSSLKRWAAKYKWHDTVKEADVLTETTSTIGMMANQVAERIENLEPIPFTVVETFEGTANAMHSMTSAMAQVVTGAMNRYLERGDAVAIELEELLAIARVTTDLGKTVATMYQALNPAPTGKGRDPERDPTTGLLPGGLAPGATPGGPAGVFDLIESLSNPPYER